MAIKFAFAGFRHGHINGLYSRALEDDGLTVVGACEEDQAARVEVIAKGDVRLTHESLDAMLDDVDCDVVAIGDYFAKRGSLAIKALERGKHVICDKPLCTRLEEIDTIEKLAGEKGLKVGCMLDLRDCAPYIGARDIIRRGTIGEIHAISFGGQHPLSLGSRPSWYFEPGKHGGTITDIAVHAIDLIPWITGLEFKSVCAARCWNSFAREFPHFKGAAQMMLTLNNGCGVLGDVSYHMPSGTGYSLPLYWRTTFFGSQGVLETSVSADSIMLALAGSDAPQYEPLPEANPGDYLRSFVNDIRGIVEEGGLNTRNICRTMRTVISIQKAADENACGVNL